MPTFRLLPVACALLLCASAVPAQDTDETKKLRTEVAQLRNRNKDLQKQLQNMQRSMGQTAQRDDALKERLKEREAELKELKAKVKALLPNTDRYPALGALVEGFAAKGSLRAEVETLAEATGVKLRVHRSVPKSVKLNLETCDLQLIQVLDLIVKNARDPEGDPLKLTWTWRSSRGVEIRALSGE